MHLLAVSCAWGLLHQTSQIVGRSATRQCLNEWLTNCSRRRRLRSQLFTPSSEMRQSWLAARMSVVLQIPIASIRTMSSLMSPSGLNSACPPSWLRSSRLSLSVPSSSLSILCYIQKTSCVESCAPLFGHSPAAVVYMCMYAYVCVSFSCASKVCCNCCLRGIQTCSKHQNKLSPRLKPQAEALKPQTDKHIGSIVVPFWGSYRMTS